MDIYVSDSTWVYEQHAKFFPEYLDNKNYQKNIKFYFI